MFTVRSPLYRQYSVWRRNPRSPSLFQRALTRAAFSCCDNTHQANLRVFVSMWHRLCGLSPSSGFDSVLLMAYQQKKELRK